MTTTLVCLAIAVGMMSLSSSWALETKWSAHDVSVLVPLPKTLNERDHLLKASDGEELGALIPRAILDQLPQLVASQDRGATYDEQLRVVAIRFDPCFKEGSQTCRPQVRMVWQAILSVDGDIIARDAAVHTFYDLTPKAWEDLLKDYSEFHKPHANSDDDLSIHPILQQEGLSVRYWSNLKRVLLKYCGARTLSRVTVMTLDFFGNQWVFRGWNVEGRNLVRLKIPGLTMTGQVVAVHQLRDVEFWGQVAPLESFGERTRRLIQNSRDALNSLREPEVFAIAQEQLEIEDPERRSTSDTNCVACHMAAPILSWSRRHFPQWPLWSTRPESGALTTDQLRAFGYSHQKPAISERVRRETRVAIQQLKRL